MRLRHIYESLDQPSLEQQVSEVIGTPARLLRIPNKKWRSEVIADYVRKQGSDKVIVFSCGNAAKALVDQGLDVISGGPQGCTFVPEKWYTPEEVAAKWPDRFDATSGHLSEKLMGMIARRFKAGVGSLRDENIIIPTGSGETVYCLKMAYPRVNFIALYDEDDPATKFDAENPFNAKVQQVALPLLRSGSGISQIGSH